MLDFLRILLLLLIGVFFLTAKGQEVFIFEHFDDFAPLLENKNDTTYVINFWATWCKPCVEELPFFNEANKKFSDHKFKMLLVSLDFMTHIESKVKPFILKNNIEPEVVALTDSKHHIWINKVNSDWTGSIPITIIYNKDFYYFKEGSMTFEELNEMITKNLIP